ncbi:sporulation membrane protein YtaF [Paenibacillus doosanensis]|uniref:sporulation membrane protein YtaF n=1 Tax=Paenibacillus doosanensis TaxID=1229154 RepID=UPI00217F3063|nr:sporulation membrane protein YtaF [Paenibacillus doosanensis]MCS7458577.1 sporulation membrane protein YtaF [Paenibacillus doosanensis]
MVWMMILGFAISSSLDNLGVGISYGIRSIRIGLLSNLLMAGICFLCSMTGIWGGQWLAKVLPGMFPAIAGAFVLVIVGIRIIVLAFPRKRSDSAEQEETASSGGHSLAGILRNPESVDTDKSGEIGLGEAAVLGIALSANAVTNGLSAGLIGLSPIAISLAAAVGSFATVWLGTVLGRKAAGIHIGSFTLGQFGTLLSGVILLIIACNSLF